MLCNVCEFLPWRSHTSLLTGFGVPIAVRITLLKVPNVYRLPRFLGAHQEPDQRLKVIGQVDHDDSGCKTYADFVSSHCSVLLSFHESNVGQMKLL